MFYQVQDYMWCLEESDNRVFFRNRHKLLRFLDDNDLTKKKRSWEEEEEDINWEKTKGLCIVEKIEIYGRLPQKERDREDIKIIELTFYRENILYIDIEKIVDWLKIKKISVITPESSLNNNLGDEISPQTSWTLAEIIQKYENYYSQEIKDVLWNFDKWISGRLGYKIPPKPYYINYFWENSPKPPFLFSFVPQQKSINVYWNFKKDKKPENLLEKYGFELEEKGHHGSGNWKFPTIKIFADLQRLKEFIQEYKIYCEK